MSSRILGVGSYLPKHIVSNIEFEQRLDTNDEWIRSRTGIEQRHIASDHEHTSDLAFEASKQAILDAGIKPSEIDLIIVCTTTSDNAFPSAATKLHGYLELQNIPSFDIQAACAGFIYGLSVADNLISSGQYNNILLVGADKMSSLLNWNDRTTCVLFGDGAGAIILQSDSTGSGVIDSKIYSDGSGYDILYTDELIGEESLGGKILMKGQVLFKHAVEKMSSSIEAILAKNSLGVEDIDHFIPHQANIRIIDNMVQRLNFDPNKVVKTVVKHANCSAASIPLALCDLKSSGKLNRGDLILFSAIGAGLTWGSALIRW
jgi:3-oxoacyl-[acyl-carrier-protein] synthase-3